MKVLRTFMLEECATPSRERGLARPRITVGPVDICGRRACRGATPPGTRQSGRVVDRLRPLYAATSAPSEFDS